MSSNIDQDLEIQRLTKELNERKEAAEFWDTWNVRATFLAGLAATFLVVTALGVSKSNRRLVKVSDELSEVKEAKFNLALTNAKSVLAGLEIQVADAKARQAKAEMELERLKNPRGLSPEAIAILKKGAHGKAVIQCLVGVPETKMFAGNLYGTLLSAGWDMSAAPSVVPVPTFNVDVGTSDVFVLGRTIAGADNDNPTTPVGALFKALKKDGYKPGAMLNTSVPDGMLLILVSHRP